MAGRRKDVHDVREIVRLLRLGQSVREIAGDLRANRRTVARYRRLALAEGWLTAPELPTAARIQERANAAAPPPPKPRPSSVEPHRARVVELRKRDVEIQAIWQILRDQHGYTGGYSSVRRFVRRLEPLTPAACVRIETSPGEEAQVDFGYAGRFLDPAYGVPRKAWVFVMTLSWSRHQYAEIVFDQRVETWIGCHVRAFEWFGGVPKKIVLDNLKSAIVTACVHDPQVQRAYRELAEHCGFAIAPCRPATPEHKGKVESGVHYVKRNALAGREFPDIHAANAHLRQWILTVAGLRDHGTTREAPLARFQGVELAALLPLPATRYEPAVYRTLKLHPDCHVAFEKSYYSAPHRLIGQKLVLRAVADRIEIYHRHERVATHPRATCPGQRRSTLAHYPPSHLAGVLATPNHVREQARLIGPRTAELVEVMLAEKPVDRLRSAMGLLALAKRYGPVRLEAACRRARLFGEAAYGPVAAMLRKDLESAPLPPELLSPGPLPKTSVFARSFTDSSVSHG